MLLFNKTVHHHNPQGGEGSHLNSALAEGVLFLVSKISRLDTSQHSSLGGFVQGKVYALPLPLTLTNLKK
jgi:hypothetical protein